jgi:hypothetical protein
MRPLWWGFSYKLQQITSRIHWSDESYSSDAFQILYDDKYLVKQLK